RSEPQSTPTLAEYARALAAAPSMWRTCCESASRARVEPVRGPYTTSRGMQHCPATCRPRVGHVQRDKRRGDAAAREAAALEETPGDAQCGDGDAGAMGSLSTGEARASGPSSAAALHRLHSRISNETVWGRAGSWADVSALPIGLRCDHYLRTRRLSWLLAHN